MYVLVVNKIHKQRKNTKNGMIFAHDWPVYWSQSGVVEDFVAQETDLQAKEKKKIFCCIRLRKWIKRDQQPISMSGIQPRLKVKTPPKRFVTIKMDYLAVILLDHTWVTVFKSVHIRSMWNYIWSVDPREIIWRPRCVSSGDFCILFLLSS